MALFNIFKKKPTRQTKEKPVRQAQDKEEKKVVLDRVQPPKIKKEQVSPTSEKPKKISGQAYRILKKIHVTEKATDLTSKNQYVFEIFTESNKNQVKGAVEDVYGVEVVDVKIINVPRKKRRLGRVAGWKKGYKKAIVKVREGQKIEVLPR